MTNLEPALIIFLSFILDLLIGDPEYRFHPIRIIGHGITFFLKIIRYFELNTRRGGVFLVLMTTGASLAGYFAIRSVLSGFHPIFTACFDLYICYSCIALKDLTRHIFPVVNALKADDLPNARKAVGMVVGRDVSFLDKVGVVRAAVETLAENFVDGLLSPLFWFVVGAIAGSFIGLSPIFTAICFMIIFKVASTLDSMVGYKNEEFLKTGWAGARLDDVMNFIPARFSLLILFAGACVSDLDPFGGMRTALRDRLKHDSPNAAHAESFTAGALHIRLGGPTKYAEGLKDKPWLGDEGSSDPEPEHIEKTIVLLNRAAWFAMVLVVLVLVWSEWS